MSCWQPFVLFDVASIIDYHEPDPQIARDKAIPLEQEVATLREKTSIITSVAIRHLFCLVTSPRKQTQRFILDAARDFV